MKKLMSNPRYQMYDFNRFIKFERNNIFVDDRGIEHYPLFAAAFADSMGTYSEVRLTGCEDIELRRRPL